MQATPDVTTIFMVVPECKTCSITEQALRNFMERRYMPTNADDHCESFAPSMLKV